MKRSKLFISAGAVLLAAVSFMATKAEKRFVNVTSARLVGISGASITNLAAGRFTTNKGSFGKTVFLVTVGARNANPVLATLTTNITSFTSKVYWH